ncbi:hypothetical protein WJX81_003439 [Elliptochloris bilobata]|uniref:Uncharacterized protein n=1 Tax=Elliptochloris bilobata TaxID=381761 RepID=A0AAW1REJ7_9CHLO
MKRSLSASRSRRASRNKRERREAHDGVTDEFNVGAAADLRPLGSHMLLPLRLLDNFTLYTLAEDDDGELGAEGSAAETLAGLEQLVDGLVEGLPLRARGVLLDHRAAAYGVAEAREVPRCRLRIPAVCDWALDYSEPGALWALTEHAWYRLVSPADGYQGAFRPALRRALLAWRCASVLLANPTAHTEAIVPRVLAKDWAGCRWDSDAEEEEDGFDPYWGVLPDAAINAAALSAEAPFLVRQLAPMLGRHAPRSPLLVRLAATAGVTVESVSRLGRPVKPLGGRGPPADSAERPQPACAFSAADTLLPGVLMAWDFCHSYRALLRLPPFPLARLRAAFADPPGFAEPRAADASADPKPAEEAVDADGAATGKFALGADGQSVLMRDVHAALLRLLDGLDDDVEEAPTLAGYGAAADLAPQDVYRPLLGTTWPELVRARLGATGDLALGGPAAAAAAALAAIEYAALPGRQRLALLEALVHAAADVDAVRSHIAAGCGGAEESALPRAAPLGADGLGNRYFRLGAEAGCDWLFVEAPGGGGWAWYTAEQLPRVLAWLDGGSDAERALAEDIFEAFQPALLELQAASLEAGEAADVESGSPAAAADGGAPAHGGSSGKGNQPVESTEDAGVPVANGTPAPAAPRGPGLSERAEADGYRLARDLTSPAAALRAELAALLAAARWWEKPPDWLQARAAVSAELAKAEDGPAFARLAWLVEDLVYDDLLKGTGWGRRRGWCRERLEECCTLAQAAVVACQLALHSRRPEDMGRLTAEGWREGVAATEAPAPQLPEQDAEVVLLKSGYTAHADQVRPPKDAQPAPLPDAWGPVVRCFLRGVEYVRGHWQRPTWQGRFAGGGAASAAEDGLVIAWLLLERAPPPGAPLTPPADAGAPEIDWSNFIFAHGFRPPRARPDFFVEAGAGSGQGGLSDSGAESDGGKRVLTRARRGKSSAHADFYMLDKGNVPILSKKAIEEAVAAARAAAAAAAGAAAEAEDEAAGAAAAGDAGTVARFWRVRRDLAAVGVYVRRVAPGEQPAPRFLLPPAEYRLRVERPWPTGLPICMPYNAPSLRHALQHANAFHWITGNLAAAFPNAGGAPADPWKGLTVAWDKYAPRGWPSRVSPWEVVEDVQGHMAKAKMEYYQKRAEQDAQRVAAQRQQALARQQAQAEAAAQRAAAAAAARSQAMLAAAQQAPLANGLHSGGAAGTAVQWTSASTQAAPAGAPAAEVPQQNSTQERRQQQGMETHAPGAQSATDEVAMAQQSMRLAAQQRQEQASLAASQAAAQAQLQQAQAQQTQAQQASQARAQQAAQAAAAAQVQRQQAAFSAAVLTSQAAAPGAVGLALGAPAGPSLKLLRLPDPAMSLPPVSLPVAGGAAAVAGAAAAVAGNASTGSSVRRSASQLHLPANAPPALLPALAQVPALNLPDPGSLSLSKPQLSAYAGGASLQAQAQIAHSVAIVNLAQIAAQRAHSSSVLQMAGAAAGSAPPALQQHLAYSAQMAAAASAGQANAAMLAISAQLPMSIGMGTQMGPMGLPGGAFAAPAPAEQQLQVSAFAGAGLSGGSSGALSGQPAHSGDHAASMGSMSMSSGGPAQAANHMAFAGGAGASGGGLGSGGGGGGFEILDAAFMDAMRDITGGDFGAEAPQQGGAGAAQQSALALAAREADDEELAKLLLTPSPPPAEPPA